MTVITEKQYVTAVGACLSTGTCSCHLKVFIFPERCLYKCTRSDRCRALTVVGLSRKQAFVFGFRLKAQTRVPLMEKSY